tara:strand:- start:4527 stop:5309 length:783 start_codon:yes stop_codon:yes gene_type:complete
VRANNQKLKDLLTVVITTHVLPSAPSVAVIESTISSIRKRFSNINECKFIVYCDSDIDNVNHKEYIKNLKKIENIEIKECRHSGFLNTGLRDNYVRAVYSSTTPYVLFCEHDWNFLRNIDTAKLLTAMHKTDEINFVRFNKRKNQLAHIDNPEVGDEDFWETYVEEQNINDHYFMKTDCIATHPHILRVDKFKKDWVKYAAINRDGITGIVEYNLNLFYKKDISILGFDSAHKKWGIYNYGSSHDEKIISHLDGSDSGRK